MIREIAEDLYDAPSCKARTSEIFVHLSNTTRAGTGDKKQDSRLVRRLVNGLMMPSIVTGAPNQLEFLRRTICFGLISIPRDFVVAHSRWEYRIEVVSTGKPTALQLNSLGRVGWELVSVAGVGELGAVEEVWCFLRRRISGRAVKTGV